MRRRNVSLWSAAILALVVGGCGGEVPEEGTEREDLESVSGKADSIPSWFKDQKTSLLCDTTQKGSFKGTDSAHLYDFDAKAGYKLTFTFKATYSSFKGAAVAIYDATTGKRLTYKRERWSNQASLTYTVTSTGALKIGVYSVIPFATASYTLALACVSPSSQCTAQGGYCTHFLTACKSGYVGSTPMDCPLGKSGQCCLPGATLTTDKTGYKDTDTIQATIQNNTSASIFLAGCSVFSWEKLAGGTWTSQGPDVVCFWEGYAKEVKAGSSYVGSLTPKGVGTWRLTSGYSVGCTAGKPLSTAGCSASYTLTSASFKVKSCPMLSPPAPSFCPNGKITAKYDTDGICITGYTCSTVTCQVSDCGPALGMPNKLCPDGKTVSGPTGKCIPQSGGTCGWEVISCPVTCKTTGCSGQICSDKDVVTTCQMESWYACLAKSECGPFASDGSCAWKQTPDYLSCMASHGK